LTDEQKLLVEKWREMGLEWTPLTWHPGRELKNKFLDLWDGSKGGYLNWRRLRGV